MDANIIVESVKRDIGKRVALRRARKAYSEEFIPKYRYVCSFGLNLVARDISYTRERIQRARDLVLYSIYSTFHTRDVGKDILYTEARLSEVKER